MSGNAISFKRIFSGSVWGILSKIISALLGFVSIPLLVSHFGKGEYGLVVLAISLNTYLKLMDMGLNIGSIRYYSTWMEKGDWDKVVVVAKSNIVFYGFIGLVNCIVFLLIGIFGTSFFDLSPEHARLFGFFMKFMALTAVFNWISSVFTQLLSASGELAWLNGMNIISTLFSFISVLVVIYFKLDISVYLILYLVSTIVIIPLNIYRLQKLPVRLKDVLLPKWNKAAFSEIFSYSIAIFFLGLFQFSADNLRPVILGKYASSGTSILTDYRIIQTISALISTFGSIFLQVLIPTVSRLLVEKNDHKIGQVVYDGTKYITVFISACVFGIIANSQLLLTLYVGESYSSLYYPLSIWMITTLLVMHNSPVSSLVLSSGDTRILLRMTIISTLVSLPITVFFAYKYEILAAVWGYFIYVLLQILFYYLYYIPNVLKLDSKRVFLKSFMPPVIAGVIAMVSVVYSNFLFQDYSLYLQLFFKSLVFLFVYAVVTLTVVFQTNELKSLWFRIVGK